MPYNYVSDPHRKSGNTGRTRERALPRLLGQLYSFRHFRGRGVDSAMTLPVTEIKDESAQEPYDQAHPSRPAESVNHRAANNDPERADNGCGRDTEGPFQFRTAHPQYPDSGANEDEG